MNDALQRSRPLWILAAAGAALGVTLAVLAAFATRPRMVSLLSDDSYYYLQIARHLAAAGESSFDGVTRTTGYHPLFAAVLTGIYALLHPGPDAYVRLMLGLNILLHALTTLVLYRAGCRWRDRATGALAAVLYGANPHAALWALTGMEASLNACALACFFWAIIPPARGARAAAAAALAVLARTDNLLVVLLGAPLLLLGATPFRPRRLAEAAGVVGAAITALGLWLLYGHAATGEWGQGSAAVKMLIREYKVSGLTPLGALEFGFNVWLQFMVKSFIKVPALKYVVCAALLAGPAAWRAMPARAAWVAYLAAAPALLGLAYALHLTRTATWYYVPPVLSLTLAAAFLARRLPERDAPRARTVALLCAALVAAEGLGYFGSKLARGRNAYQRDMLELAEWMGDRLPAGSRVGAWDAGIYSFYSGLCVINLDGLVNNEIAPLLRANRGRWPAWHAQGIDSVAHYERWYAGNPDQYWQYWKDRDIRYLVGSTRWLTAIPPEWQGARLVVLRAPAAHHSASPKALYAIQWPRNETP